MRSWDTRWSIMLATVMVSVGLSLPAYAQLWNGEYTSNDYTSNITITTSVTDLVEIDATAPSTGCPCRALVSYFVPFSAGTNGGDIDTWVLDSNGIMYASNSTHLTASVDDGTAVSDYSSDTFSNSEDVTFTLEAYAKNTGNKAITETTTAGRINYFKVLFLPSD